MRRLLVWTMVAGLGAVPQLAWAKKKGGGGSHGQAPSARAIAELSGKFKWGSSPDDVLKVIDEGLTKKYAELISKEPDVYKQDQLRQQHQDELKKIKDSYIKFDGRKTGWDSSLVDKEFGQRNDESMMVLWEKDQKRFLFFWHERLYKQFIAFNAEHPVFEGKSFDDFAKLIQDRYGQADMKLAALRTKDDVKLDHLEWPSSGDYTLWAIDETGFYGNFCLKLQQTSVFPQVERERAEHTPRASTHNAIIDSVTAPETNPADPNADVVDSIVGKKH